MINSLIKQYESCKIQYKQTLESRFGNKSLLQYNGDLFTANSCAIEGNSFTVNETRDIREHGIFFKLQNKSMFEALEIQDHLKAFEFLFSDMSRPLTEELLIETQKILTKNTIEFSKGYEPGKYTKTQMAAGDTIFPPHEQSIRSVPFLMEGTQKAIDENKVHPIEISAKFHQYFIYLHPFPDGNGRTGRLISNYILAKTNNPIVIIQKDRKQEYLNALMDSHKHQDTSIITKFFIQTSINRMKSELEQIKTKIPNTKKNLDGGITFFF